MAVSSWPSSPLAAADRAFRLLIEPPTLLTVDGRRYPGLPYAVLTLDRLRSLLLAARTDTSVRDAVWADLVVRARRDGPGWVIAAVGVAMPGLRRAAGLLTRGWRGDHDDIDAELLAVFVARLESVDVTQPRVCGRLIDAGVRAARKVRDAQSDTVWVRGEVTGPLAPVRPWDHPDLVLARAVAAGVIDADEANLIAVTRLEHATLAEAAARAGISAGVASAWRAKAERRLTRAIHAGDLTAVTLRSRVRRVARQQPDSEPLWVAVGAAAAAPTRQQPALEGKASDPTSGADAAAAAVTRPA